MPNSAKLESRARERFWAGTSARPDSSCVPSCAGIAIAPPEPLKNCVNQFMKKTDSDCVAGFPHRVQTCHVEVIKNDGRHQKSQKSSDHGVMHITSDLHYSTFWTCSFSRSIA